jgi:hypothetical protein
MKIQKQLDTVLERAIVFGIHASEEPAGGDPVNKTPEEQLAETQAALEAANKAAEEAKAALDGQKITVKIDGVQQEMTMEEARTALSKVGGADKRFAEAAEIKKSAERGIKIAELFEKVNKEEPDDKDVAELAGLLNLDPTLFVGKGGKKDGKEKPPQKISLDDLSPELRSQLEYENLRNIEEAKKKIFEEVKQGVDKDEILGKMNSVAKEAGNEEFLVAAAEMVHEDVLRKIQNGKPFGTEMVASSIQAARARLKRFGTPEQASKTPTVIMGLGQPGGEPVSVQPDEPVKRVDSSESDYSTNFVKRFFQQKLQSQLSKT